MSASVSAATSGPAASPDQKLTAEELDQARLFLRQTQNAVIGATQGLTDTQWRFKPSPDRWSILENLDHIVIVQERVLGAILDQLANAPAPPAGWDCDAVDAIVMHQFSTRLNKFSAPEVVRPVDQVVPAERLNRLIRNYGRLAERLESAVGLRQHALEAAPLKAVSKGRFTVMDGYQWILTAAAHAERHAKQMLEVRADAGYPS